MNLTQRALEKLGVKVVSTRGAKGFALCPFHEERKPSWMVYLSGDRAGGYRCMSCGAHGGLVSLVAHRRGCSRDGAREWLDRLREGEEVEAAPVAFDPVRLVVAPLGRVGFRLPEEAVVKPLAAWPETPREYAKRRHLTHRQVADWGIGYAVSGRLAGRLVLPVRDASGAPRSYMARTFSDHEARYYYPMGRERPDLDVVFGEQHWPAPGERPLVVVCEGALNALAVDRSGLFYVRGRLPLRVPVAALGGSDPRPVHVGKLATFGHVLVMTDDDPAGDGAAVQLGKQLARHTRVTRVSLGEGRDADDIPAEELRKAVWDSLT